jgi:hypothetical protein
MSTLADCEAIWAEGGWQGAASAPGLRCVRSVAILETALVCLTSYAHATMNQDNIAIEEVLSDFVVCPSLPIEFLMISCNNFNHAYIIWNR